MPKKILVVAFGLGIGIYFGLLIVDNVWSRKKNEPLILNPIVKDNKQVVGFLPYWLIAKADKDYTKYINTFSYFGLTISPDGSIEKYVNPGESEPGLLALQTGKVDPFLKDSDKNKVKKSLLVFSGNEESIGQLLADPITSANNMMDEVAPIMKNSGFTDLNLDIESVKTASDSARQHFATFVKIVKNRLDKNKLGTLTIDISPISLYKNFLIDLNIVKNYIDYVILMAYDYHYQGSSVTGAVSPIGGAGIDEEFDIDVSIQEALGIVSPDKIILGVPLYGYEWETINDTPHAGVIPESGIVASNRRVEKQLKTCTGCTASFEEKTKEALLVYKDKETGSYHQIYYPTKQSMNEKIKLAKKYDLAGLALWALGYEGNDILEPLIKYK